MFTGLIEAIGFVSTVEKRGESTRIVFSSPWGLTELQAGDSISVDGACLTLVAVDGETFTADVSEETIARTTLGQLKPRDPVNLERPLTPVDRLGGRSGPRRRHGHHFPNPARGEFQHHDVSSVEGFAPLCGGKGIGGHRWDQFDGK